MRQTHSRHPQRVYFVCSSYYALLGLRPLIELVRSKGPAVTVYIPPERMDRHKSAQFLGLPLENVEEGPDIGRLRLVILSKLDQWFRLFFTSQNFSSMYGKILFDEKKNRPVWSNFLAKIFPKSDRPNQLYVQLFSRLSPRCFTDGPVVATTQVRMPFLLCHPRTELHLIVDSWDHPIKAPFFVRPKHAYVWNSDLAKAVKLNQGINTTHIIYPFRFHYIDIAKKNGPRKEASLPENYFVYAFASYRNYPELFRGEMALVRELARYASERQITLYIKPRPENTIGTFEELEHCPWVKIGPMVDENTAKALPVLVLDDDYNQHRFELLAKARLFINAASSLVFEAARTACPILQIDLDPNDPQAGNFAVWADNPHLKNYLKQHPSCFRHRIGEYEALRAQLDQIFHDDSASRRFSKQIESWPWQFDNAQATLELIARHLEIC